MSRAATLLIAGAVALATTPAMPQDGEFVGLVPAPVDPDIGVNNLHDLCADMFQDAYMCETGDIIGHQLKAPFPGTDSGWIRPTIVAGDATQVVDASGITGTLLDDFTCFQWTDSRSTVNGLIMAHIHGNIPEGPDAVIFSTACSSSTRGLACCVDRAPPKPK